MDILVREYLDDLADFVFDEHPWVYWRWRFCGWGSLFEWLEECEPGVLSDYSDYCRGEGDWESSHQAQGGLVDGGKSDGHSAYQERVGRRIDNLIQKGR